MEKEERNELQFTHCHNHSVFSMKDGISSISRMIDTCKKYKFPALAITDHGSVSGWIEQYKLCIESGLKPIFGCELYINNKRKQILKVVNLLNKDDNELTREQTSKFKEFRDNNRKASHIVLLAKNRIGYYNLLKIHNDAYFAGFYYRPQTDLEFLKANSEGLIATSACAGSEISKALTVDYRNGLTTIESYKQIFKDDFYLELMPIDLPEQVELNKLLMKAAKDTNTKLIFTTDCHYIDKEGHEAHNLLLAIQSKEEDPAKAWKFSTSDLFMCSLQECLDCIKNEHSYIPESVVQECLRNIDEIVSKVELFALDRNTKLPKIENAKEKILEKVKSSLKEKNLYDNKQYTDRLKTEFNVIAELGLIDYFYVVYDYVMFAKSQGIWVGPRGSASGCLLLYLLDVIDIDPIKYNLMFERFLNKQRIAKQLCLEI